MPLQQGAAGSSRAHVLACQEQRLEHIFLCFLTRHLQHLHTLHYDALVKASQRRPLHVHLLSDHKLAAPQDMHTILGMTSPISCLTCSPCCSSLPQTAGYAGILLSVPTVLYEIIAYVLPGLTKSERNFLAPIVFGSSILFYAG